MTTKKIISKIARMANQEEFNMIINHIILALKNDNEKLGIEFDSDEEINSYFDYKKDLVVTRIDFEFSTNESFTIFSCVELVNIFGTNDYIKAIYNYSLVDGNLIDISLDDII